MAIAETYNELIMEKIIREIILEGTELTIGEIESRFNAFTESNDTAEPLFDNEGAHTSDEEASSASKYNNTHDEILRDLTVLYSELFKLSDGAMLYLDRWRVDARTLEARLAKLEEEIVELLIIAEDTEGYFGFVADTFDDTSLIDLNNTDALIDLTGHTVSINPSNAGATRL